jgi:hypothetical protein
MTAEAPNLASHGHGRRGFTVDAVSRWSAERGVGRLETVRLRVRLLALLLIATIAAGCGGGTGTATEPPPPGSARATGVGAASPGPDTSAAPGTSGGESPAPGDESAEPGEATTEPDASPAVDDPFLGRVVQTAVARLRLRAEPATDADLTATLPRGEALFVLDGPRDADGYAWYEVVRMRGDEAVGWVASASPDGEPWIAEAEAACPETPATFENLRGLSAGERVACFSGTPITLDARLTTCNCDIDSATFDPEWFNISLFEGAPIVLAEPAGAGSIDLADGLLLVLDPDGEADDPLPLDSVVEVTGVFDHPAAQTCTSSVDGGEPEPTVSCRFVFAVTSLRAAP